MDGPLVLVLLVLKIVGENRFFFYSALTITVIFWFRKLDTF